MRTYFLLSNSIYPKLPSVLLAVHQSNAKNFSFMVKILSKICREINQIRGFPSIHSFTFIYAASLKYNFK